MNDDTLSKLRNTVWTRAVSLYFVVVAILATLFLGLEYESLTRGVVLLMAGQTFYFFGMAWWTWELARRFEIIDEAFVQHAREQHQTGVDSAASLVMTQTNEDRNVAQDVENPPKMTVVGEDGVEGIDYWK